MSILGINRTSSSSSSHTSSSSNMSINSISPFREFTKQASFYLKEKVKTARLALTDVTPAQLLTEEATDGNPTAPDSKTMGFISRAAFEVDDYDRIVEILHKKLSKFDRKEWRPSYKALVLLEHLLTHGPESIAEEFQVEKPTIKHMLCFQHVDERGFNWGSCVRKKSERILKLLEKGPLLKEERDRARKVTSGIKGFGSFKVSSAQRIHMASEDKETFRRSHSQFNEHEDEEDENVQQITNDDILSGGSIKTTVVEKPLENKLVYGTENSGMTTSLKENVAPKMHAWSRTRESKPLIMGGRVGSNDGISMEEDHPFNNREEKQGGLSLLAASEDI